MLGIDPKPERKMSQKELSQALGPLSASDHSRMMAMLASTATNDTAPSWRAAALFLPRKTGVFRI
jgi:hypothetical protein